MTTAKIPQFAALLTLPPMKLTPPTKRVSLGANPKKRPPKAPPKVVSSANLVPPATRNWKQGEYKHNTAMRISLARAHAAQPPLIALAGSPADVAKY